MKPVLVSVKSALLALFREQIACCAGRHWSLRATACIRGGIWTGSSFRLHPETVRNIGISLSIMCSNYLDAGMTLALRGFAVPSSTVEAYMKTSTLAWSLVAGLALAATPLHAQHVSAEVVVRGGPVDGRVVVDDGYSSYRRPVRRVVVERYTPRVVRVERFRHRHGKHWRRKGYREVIVYYVDGRYYDRIAWSHPRAYEVVVYERDGRFYRDD